MSPWVALGLGHQATRMVGVELRGVASRYEGPDTGGLQAPFRWLLKAPAAGALDRIRELSPDPGGTGEVRLLDGSRLPVSRDRMPELRRRLA